MWALSPAIAEPMIQYSLASSYLVYLECPDVFFSPLAPPTGNKEKCGWLARLVATHKLTMSLVLYDLYYLLFRSNFLEIQWLYIAVMQLQYVHYSIYIHLSTQHPHPSVNDGCHALNLWCVHAPQLSHCHAGYKHARVS